MPTPPPQQQQRPVSPPPSALAPIVIYQTRGDYRELVPIRLSRDKQQVLSYPSRVDLGSPGHFATPILLADGYLLDKRGVGPESAFLRLTYSEYYALGRDPSPEELLDYILDDEPFLFLAVVDRKQLRDDSPQSLEQYIKSGAPGATILIDRRGE